MTAPAVAEPLLRATGLSVARGRTTIVSGVELALHAGETVALLGPNGAGKSTLLASLSGALEPAAGRIERAGRVAIALQSAELARRSVLANVTLALAWWGVPREQRIARARAALEALGAGQLAGRRADQLSGGEQRRVHLARALAVQAEVLLLDEPFAGLDAETRAALLEDAVSVLRSPARATLVVVHDRAEAWALADRLLVLLDGVIAADGPPRALLEAPPTAQVARFLGYDGELAEPGGGVQLTRAAQVSLDADGPLRAEVTRVVPREDGARVELRLEHGRLYALAGEPPPRVGDTVRLRIAGSVRFSAAPRSPSSP